MEARVMDKVRLDTAEVVFAAASKPDFDILNAIRPGLLKSGEVKDILEVISWPEWEARRAARKQSGT